MFLKKAKTLYDKLEQVMFKFPDTSEKFKLANFLGGILITGSTRSGKSSAVLKHFVKAWFKKGYGGLYTTTRLGDDKDLINWATQSDRAEDVVLFDKNSNFRFNLLEYYSNEDTNILTDKLLQIQELISSFQSGSKGDKEEAFWKNTTKTLLDMILTLVALSKVKLSWKLIRKIALGTFSEEEHQRYFDLRAILETTDEDSEEWLNAFSEYQRWKERNWFIQCFELANERTEMNEEELELMQVVGEYFMDEYPKLSTKTTSIIIQMVISITTPFESKGILRSHFSEGLSPEIHPSVTTKSNKIVIIGFGPKEHKLAGLVATSIMKMTYQEFWEARDIKKVGLDATPIMLCIDEFQMYFSNASKDTLFASTAGGSLVSQVYVTQNLDNLIMACGGNSPESRAKSLCANLNTKCFVSNSSYSTNLWASNMIGKHWVDTTSTQINLESSNSQTYGQAYHYKVPIDHFTTLKTGRKENNYQVESIVFQTGRKWKSNNDQNFAEITFSQV